MKSILCKEGPSTSMKVRRFLRLFVGLVLLFVPALAMAQIVSTEVPLPNGWRFRATGMALDGVQYGFDRSGNFFLDPGAPGADGFSFTIRNDGKTNFDHKVFFGDKDAFTGVLSADDLKAASGKPLRVLDKDGNEVFKSKIFTDRASLKAAQPKPPAPGSGGGLFPGRGTFRIRSEPIGGGETGGLVPCGKEGPCTLQQLLLLGVNIFNWLLAIGGAAALLALIVAGIRYLTAVLQGADSSAIAAAKQSVVYAIIGLVVLLTAVVLVRTVITWLGKGGGFPTEYQEPGDLVR